VFVLPLGEAPVTVAGEEEVQLYVTLLVAEVNVTAVVDCPEQMVCGEGLNVMPGAGFTVIVKA
jgi:hypothetical protein